MKKCCWQRPIKQLYKLRWISIFSTWEKDENGHVFQAEAPGHPPSDVDGSQIWSEPRNSTNQSWKTHVNPTYASKCYHPAQNHCQQKLRWENSTKTSLQALQHLARTPAFIRPRHVKQSVFHLTWTVACRYPGQGGGRNPWRIYHSGAFRAMCSSQSS